jgi:plasmid stability protein
MRNVTVVLDPDTARRLRMAAARSDMSVSAYVARLLAVRPAVTGFAENGPAPYRPEAPAATTKITLSLPTEVVSRLRVDAAQAGKSMSRHLADLVSALSVTPRPSQRQALADRLALHHPSLLDMDDRTPSAAEQSPPSGAKMTQAEALCIWLAAPLMNITTHGRAPTRDELYDDD